jgi:hypothetical protein
MVDESYTPTADDFHDLAGICVTEALVVGSYNTPHSVAEANQYDDLAAWCRRKALGQCHGGACDHQPKMWQFLWLAAMCSSRAADVYRSTMDRERFTNLDAWCLRQAQEVENDG